MSAVATVSDPFVVASWNIREALPPGSGGDAARRSARREIADVLRDNEVDIVALQEVDFDEHGSSPTLAYLMSATDLRHVSRLPLSPSSFFPGQAAGVAILSRLPAVPGRTGYFMNPGLSVEVDGRRLSSHDKGFVSLVVSLPNAGPLHAVSLHLLPYHVFRRSPSDPEFESVWSDATGQLAPFSKAKSVICGDFNSSDRSLLVGPDKLDVSGTNFRPTYRGMAADDILISSSLKLSEARLLDNFSDHAVYIAAVVAQCET
jgi:endonuclease/exonuclease/phosphatase family metal-dependent hydrolase